MGYASGNKNDEKIISKIWKLRKEIFKMKNYLRELSNDFMINDIPMPKPHDFKTIKKTPNKDAGRCVNTGELIVNPYNIRIYETTWTYKLIRDDQLALIYNEVFKQGVENFANKKFLSLDSNTFKHISYITYEQDDFQAPTVTSVQADGHRYFKDVSFKFTSVGQVVEY